MESSINADGLEQLQNSLSNSLNKTSDFSDLEPILKPIFLEDAADRFASAPAVDVGGTVYGGAYWKPLSPRSRRTGRILIDSHTLEKSLTVEGDGNNIFEINGTEVLFGSNVPYAARQDDDRPFLFWHPKLLEKVSEAVITWLTQIT